jgi:hypothetical protein
MNTPNSNLENNISALITSQQQNLKLVSQSQKEHLYQRIHAEWLQRQLPVKEFPAAVLVALSLLVVSGFFFGLVWLWQQGSNMQPLSILLLFSGAANLIMAPVAAIYLVQFRRKQNETMD